MAVDVPEHSASQRRLLFGGTARFAVQSLGRQPGKQGIALINQHHPLAVMLRRFRS